MCGQSATGAAGGRMSFGVIEEGCLELASAAKSMFVRTRFAAPIHQMSGALLKVQY